MRRRLWAQRSTTLSFHALRASSRYLICAPLTPSRGPAVGLLVVLRGDEPAVFDGTELTWEPFGGPVVSAAAVFAAVVALAAVAALAHAGLAAGPCRTRAYPLSGAAARMDLARLELPERLVRRYGTDAELTLGISNLSGTRGSALHLVAAADLGWMLSLTTERLVRGAATRRASLGLDGSGIPDFSRAASASGSVK